jgi:glycerol kinase
MSFVLAIDQGTTSSRAMVFGADLSVKAVAQAEFPQHFPASGWVEHDPDDIWNSTVAVCRDALRKAGLTHKDIAAIGITNQRETTVVWDRATGKAVHRAIVWQDRRTADICAKLKDEGHEGAITAKTGLISQAPRSPGFSTMFPVHARAPSAANCCSAPSIAICCGA